MVVGDGKTALYNFRKESIRRSRQAARDYILKILSIIPTLPTIGGQSLRIGVCKKR